MNLSHLIYWQFFAKLSILVTNGISSCYYWKRSVIKKIWFHWGNVFPTTHSLYVMFSDTVFWLLWLKQRKGFWVHCFVTIFILYSWSFFVSLNFCFWVILQHSRWILLVITSHIIRTLSHKHRLNEKLIFFNEFDAVFSQCLTDYLIFRFICNFYFSPIANCKWWGLLKVPFIDAGSSLSSIFSGELIIFLTLNLF